MSSSKASFGSLLKSEARNATLYVSSNFLTQIGGFLLIPIFWKRLTPTDYGIVAIRDMIWGFSGAFLALSLDNALTRFYYDWPEEERAKRTGVIWITCWFNTLVGGTIIIFLVRPLAAILFPDIPYMPFLFLGLIGSMLGNLSIIPISLLRIKRLVNLYLIYNITTFLLVNGLSIYFVVVLKQQLRGLLIGQMWGHGILTLICTVLMLMNARVYFNASHLRELLRYSLPMLPPQLISQLSSVLCRFLLQRFGSVEALGIYSLSRKFGDIITRLHSALKLNFVPFLFETFSTRKEEGKNTIARMVPFYLASYFVVGLGISLFIAEFVEWIDRPAYFPVVRFVPYLVGIAILESLNVYYGQGILLAKRTELLWIPSTAFTIATVIFSLLLIKPFHIWGIIGTNVLGITAFLIASIAISQRVCPIPHKWPSVLLMAGVAVAMHFVKKGFHADHLLGNVLISTVIGACFLLSVVLVATKGHMNQLMSAQGFPGGIAAAIRGKFTRDKSSTDPLKGEKGQS